jgi:phosphinothricin acetyltransferase
MSVVVRDASIGDVPAILAITNAAIETTTANWSDEPRTLEEQLAWFHEKLATGLPVLAAAAGNDVVGWATFGSFRHSSGYRHTVEQSVYVADGRRRSGIGTALGAELIVRARARGVHTIVAGCEASNTASIRLHERLGFVETGRLTEVGTKFGRWLDLVFLQLTLEE